MNYEFQTIKRNCELRSRWCLFAVIRISASYNNICKLVVLHIFDTRTYVLRSDLDVQHTVSGFGLLFVKPSPSLDYLRLT
jgi:hypothetical protein